MSQAELQVVEGGEPNGQDKLVGQTIDGRYLVEKVLGEGGMGLVYKAKHVVLQKPLALKVLRPDVSKDEEHVQNGRGCVVGQGQYRQWRNICHMRIL